MLILTVSRDQMEGLSDVLIHRGKISHNELLPDSDQNQNDENIFDQKLERSLLVVVYSLLNPLIHLQVQVRVSSIAHIRGIIIIDKDTEDMQVPCPKCGEYFAKRGIHNHTRKCEASDFKARVVNITIVSVLTWITESVVRTILFVIFIWAFCEYICSIYRGNVKHVEQLFEDFLESLIFKLVQARSKYRTIETEQQQAGTFSNIASNTINHLFQKPFMQQANPQDTADGSK
jgi:hypothetical protein